MSVVVDPVIQLMSVSKDFKRQKLHTGHKDGVLLSVVLTGVSAQQGTKVEILNSLLVSVHKLTPALLALLGLHLVLINMGSEIWVGQELGESSNSVVVNLIVLGRKAQFAALALGKNGHVSLGMRNSLDSELLFNVLEVLGGFGVKSVQ